MSFVAELCRVHISRQSHSFLALIHLLEFGKLKEAILKSSAKTEEDPEFRNSGHRKCQHDKRCVSKITKLQYFALDSMIIAL